MRRLLFPILFGLVMGLGFLLITLIGNWIGWVVFAVGLIGGSVAIAVQN